VSSRSTATALPFVLEDFLCWKIFHVIKCHSVSQQLIEIHKASNSNWQEMLTIIVFHTACEQLVLVATVFVLVEAYGSFCTVCGIHKASNNCELCIPQQEVASALSL